MVRGAVTSGGCSAGPTTTTSLRARSDRNGHQAVRRRPPARRRDQVGRRPPQVPLPRFAVEMLRNRRALPYLGQQAVISPSTTGTLRDPNNMGKEWRKAREELGVHAVTTHSWRKTVATLTDDSVLWIAGGGRLVSRDGPHLAVGVGSVRSEVLVGDLRDQLPRAGAGLPCSIVCRCRFRGFRSPTRRRPPSQLSLCWWWCTSWRFPASAGSALWSSG